MSFFFIGVWGFGGYLFVFRFDGEFGNVSVEGGFVGVVGGFVGWLIRVGVVVVWF